MTKNRDFDEIYGFHAVNAALRNKSRKFKNLIISTKNKNRISKNLLIKIEKLTEIPNKEINRIYGNEDKHQGIILKATKINQPSIEDIVKNCNSEKEIIVMLDHVNDPNNIGSIMRSCSLFNCKNLIVSKDSAPEITSSMIKAASGALEVVNYIKVTNLSRTISLLKKNNFWAIGLDSNEVIHNNFDMPKRCLLIMGAENKGLRELTKKNCDEIQNIPLSKNNKYCLESLNVSNACSIALYKHFVN